MEKHSAKLLLNGIALNKYPSREDNTFLVLFEYGNYDNKQGYWSYEQLDLQMDYCLDFLKVMHTYFNFIFIFDHLCGHDWARDCGLKASITRK